MIRSLRARARGLPRLLGGVLARLLLVLVLDLLVDVLLGVGLLLLAAAAVVHRSSDADQKSGRHAVAGNRIMFSK